jgi:hypothetical protein
MTASNVALGDVMMPMKRESKPIGAGVAPVSVVVVIAGESLTKSEFDPMGMH